MKTFECADGEYSIETGSDLVWLNHKDADGQETSTYMTKEAAMGLGRALLAVVGPDEETGRVRISTEEMDALPVGAKVFDRDGDELTRVESGWNYSSVIANHSWLTWGFSAKDVSESYSPMTKEVQ